MSSEESDGASFLLLLPPPPTPLSHAGLDKSYGDTVRQVLKEADSASQESTDASMLEIALACPHLVHHQSQSRSQLYKETQSLVAAVYKLVCVLAAQDNVDVEDRDGIDVRVILVAWSPDHPTAPSTSPLGPVVDLQTLAAAQRPWQYAFGVENAEGEAFVRAFVQAKTGHGSRGGNVTRSEQGPHSHTTESTNASVAVGGTFDHLHIGHKLLLTMTLFAIDQANSSDNKDRSVVIGITGDELLKNKKHAEYLESWQDRQIAAYRFVRSIIDFQPPDAQAPTIRELHESGPNGHAVHVSYATGLTLKFVEIWDPFGPTITDEGISALIISAETRSGGKAVNDKRTEKGWKLLDIFEVDVLDAEDVTFAEQGNDRTDFQSKLSSTEIRRKLGEKASAAPA